ncbi:MAG TPA: protein kinase [Candidatus Angelobacter sp.]|nr:protein kinase [Candidatus Angelobacter sp.]
MIAGRWEQIKDFFENALDLSPQERQSFLARLSLENPPVANEVVRLLRSYEEAGDFLVQPCTFASEFLEDLEVEQYRFSAGDVVCGRFRIVDLIGQGGMGEVYEALDEELEDHVALKTLRSEIFTHELFTSRFRREIQLARKVTHPNVCRIFDSFKHALSEGVYLPVLSMELLLGQTLEGYLKDHGRLSVSEALRIVRQIISGLSAIHAAGIVHRDLKPANLVIVPLPAAVPSARAEAIAKELNQNGDQSGADFQVKITDFGIAGQIPNGLSAVAQSESSKLLGTPDYMAPEQFELGQTSIQSDIYALGLVLYQMVTGTKPFGHVPAWKRLTTDPLPPRKAAPELPENWNKTILCCLERNPEYRFQSAQAVLDSLERVGSTAVIPHKPLPLRLRRALLSKSGLAFTFFFMTMALSILFYRLYEWQPVFSEGARVLFPEIQINKELLASDETLGAVTDLMRNQLEDSPRLLLLNRRQIETLSLQMAQQGESSSQERHGGDLAQRATMREMAWRGGANLFLLGTLSRTGNKYVLNLWAEEVGQQPNVELRHWERSFTAKNKDTIFDVVQQGGYWVRNLLEYLPESRLKKEPLPQSTTTSSWHALLLFSQAEKLQAAGQKRQAIALLEESTQVDPDFSLAYMRLGDLYNSLRDEKHGFFYWNKAMMTLQRRQVTQRESLRINALFAQDSGNWKGSEEAFKSFETLYPYDYLPSFYLATTLANLDRPQDALAKDKQAESKQPDAYYPVAQEARLELVLGQLSDTEKAINRLREMHRQDAADAIQVSLDMLQENFSRAFEALGRMNQSHDPLYKSRGYSLHAALLAEMRRFPEAIKILKEGISFDSANGLNFNEADKWLAVAYLRLRVHALSSCRGAAMQAIKKESGRLHLLKAGTLLARAGFTAEATQVLHSLPTMKGIPVFEQAVHRLQGEIWEAEGKPQQALQEMQIASDLDAPSSPREYLALAWEKAGNASQALALYRKIVASPAAVWQSPENYDPGFWAEMEQKYIALHPPLDDEVLKHAKTRIARLQKFSTAVH